MLVRPFVPKRNYYRSRIQVADKVFGALNTSLLTIQKIYYLLDILLTLFEFNVSLGPWDGIWERAVNLRLFIKYDPPFFEKFSEIFGRHHLACSAHKIFQYG
ncbi:hypothetical protein RRF57_000829 [Xylaria bambusicola]|uniref:Uncharacterized protein n=1 Tax=Xylaria bambusicola TaxID=326684 RepID=A0AAN7UBF4_9PEZI